MRIVSIPRGFFKIYDYSIRNGIFEKFREHWAPLLDEWERLRSTYKMSFEDLSKQFKFKKHANALVYKKYEKMEMGEYVQIDHMTVTMREEI